MTLDLAAVNRQIKQMGEALRANQAEVEARLQKALATLREQAAQWEALAHKIRLGRAKWLPAIPTEPLDARYAPPPLPSDFIVIATDGAVIEPTHHAAAFCYLVNVGRVALHYGSPAQATLDSQPTLYYRDEDLYLAQGQRRELVEGHLLDAKRSGAEMAALAEMAASLSPRRPALALHDGSLVLLALAGRGVEDYLRESLLAPFLASFERLRELGLPLVGYISRPRHAEVTGALRVALCPHPAPDCAHNCRSRASPPCDSVAGVHDSHLLALLPLAPGERSALFESRHSLSLRHYGPHAVHFFYLNVGPEVVRVEVPEWVARDGARLNLAHALAYDQCQRGNGYPTALGEAHEQAVMGGAERRLFEELLASALQRHGLPAGLSRKEMSKRRRAV